ncbi:MAG: CBS domain-containing protein [Saprospiraceae bacterium]|nr:MAG: CBS domain-containing protein [Saprospiraceae bacterium]
MGAEKVAIIKDKSMRLKATRHLLGDLKALEWMLERGVFESGVQRIGAEQELSITGGDWKPAPVLMEILAQVNDEHFTTEFAKFNLEINLDPLVFTGDCFTRMEQDLSSLIAKGEKIARTLNAHLILAGIVPTLRRSDINLKNITPLPRYHHLINALRELRGESFEFRIEGANQWISKAEDSFIESCNTSFQVHFQVHPTEFVQAYNWALAISAPVLAAATNSPLLLGKRLWRETRIALFEQSTDTRNSSHVYRDQPPRVSFGSGWVKNSVLDIYREEATIHKILFASTREEDAGKVLLKGGVPNLYELCIHNGTIYNWNRACYGITDGKPHLRIENRMLPAGPTIIDEVANAAFWTGLMNGLPEEYKNIREIMDFQTARRNFQYAAKLGLGANFYWPHTNKQIPAGELILKELLPIAREGLKKSGIAADDITRLAGIIEERVSSGKTGSQWMLDALSQLQQNGSKDEALVALTAGMSKRQQEGKPVHLWNLPEMAEAGTWKNRFSTIEQIMVTELYTVTEDDPVDLVANIMFWRNIRHVPVENPKGEITGLVTCKLLMFYYSNNYQPGKKACVKDIMTTHLITVSPQTKTTDAIELMMKNDVACLPVIYQNKLAGLVTERDFVKISAELLTETDEALKV